MPHKCTKCGKVYSEGTDSILTEGCECGNRLFLYIRKISDDEADKLTKKNAAVEAKKKSRKRLKKIIKESEEERKKNIGRIIKKGFNKVLKKKEDLSKEVEDIWNVKVEGGVYEIDLEALMSRQPVIVSGEEGRYLLSLSSAFDKKKGKKYTELVKK